MCKPLDMYTQMHSSDYVRDIALDSREYENLSGCSRLGREALRPHRYRITLRIWEGQDTSSSSDSWISSMVVTSWRAPILTPGRSEPRLSD